jgi:hypothetical protein
MDLTKTSAKIRVGQQDVGLLIGEQVSFDVNEDGEDDLLVSVLSITYPRLTLHAKLIEKEPTPELITPEQVEKTITPIDEATLAAIDEMPSEPLIMEETRITGNVVAEPGITPRLHPVHIVALLLTGIFTVILVRKSQA